jgi:transcriptional regulator with XRE-family HTH domain
LNASFGHGFVQVGRRNSIGENKVVGSMIDVGSRLRAFRKKKGISLNKLSQITGIAASNLSCIELNKSSPTLITLVKIAEAFDARVGEFMDELIYHEVALCPSSEAISETGDDAGISVSLLNGRIPLRKLEARLITIEEAPKNGAPVPGYGTERVIYCIKGSLCCETSKHKLEIIEGDALYLRSEAAAVLTPTSETPASILLINQAP